MDLLSPAEHAHILTALSREVLARGQQNSTLFDQAAGTERDEMLRRNNDAIHEIEALQEKIRDHDLYVDPD